MSIGLLEKFAQEASKRSEIVAAAMVFFVVIMMIIPLSPVVLDIFISINISISILLILISVFIPTPLSFSSFPSVLLVSTLFRLSITVASTRLILLDANAGHIIEAFGDFVVGGNIAVGLVIFLIISIVNFIVVTKGSERVAEVAARFSLDGMPGKQMSIDSDLRANLIDQHQAKRRRSLLERETQLFGAMDGALKFVKGDAIAGLVIAAVNLIGGLIIGVIQRDMSFSQAGHVYSLLTVGDGLVAQIPSLLVSIAAGLVVTRVTKGDDEISSSVAKDMVAELFGTPKALMVACFFSLVFASVPGMPSFAFIGMAGALAAVCFFQRRALAFANSSGANDAMDDLASTARHSEVQDRFEFKVADPLALSISSHIKDDDFQLIANLARMARNAFNEEMGIVISAFKIERRKQVHDIELRIHNVPYMFFRWTPGQMFAHTDRTTLEQHGIAFEVELDAASQRHFHLIDAAAAAQCAKQGIPVHTVENRLIESIKATLVKQVKRLFGYSEFNKFIQNQEAIQSDLVKELQRALPNQKLQDIFHRLLSENVPLNNFETVAQRLIEWSQKERDLVVLAEHVRLGLGSQICFNYSHEGVLPCYLVAPDIEDIVRSGFRQTSTGSYMALDNDTQEALFRCIENTIVFPNAEQCTPVILCTIDVRRYMRRLLEDRFNWIPVLSKEELGTQVQIKSLGILTLDNQG